MGRPLSPDSRLVLIQLEDSPKTIDQLVASTGVDKIKLAYMLRDLRKLGWVSVAAFLRKSRWRVRVYGLVRRLPIAAREVKPSVIAPPAEVAALLAAFGINAPRRPPRGRRVRAAR